MSRRDEPLRRRLRCDRHRCGELRRLLAEFGLPVVLVTHDRLEALARFCIGNGHLLNIEIKPTPGTEAATGTAVAQLAAQLWQGAAVPPLLTSFKPEALAAAQQAAPELPRGLLVDTLWEGWFDKALALECVAVVANYALWDAEMVARVHGAGMRCLSYTVNDEWAAQHLLALGTDGIITDRVDLFSPA